MVYDKDEKDKLTLKNNNFVSDYIVSIIWNIYYFLQFYILWICVHTLASNVYTHLCAHFSFNGFLMSPFLVSTPHCKALHWLTNKSLSCIENMWTILGGWFITKIVHFELNRNKEN